jgi:hypothetical protein
MCQSRIRMRDNINRLSKKSKQEDEKINISDFKQDDLTDISRYNEFLYILGLAIYDIFSNNHEVIGYDNKIYDFGSFRGSGQFIADFFKDNFPDNSEKYDYMDFYMGTIWIKERGTLTSFYEYIFEKLKDLNCDWKYSFPRMHLIDLNKRFETSSDYKSEDYKPDKALQKQLELTESDKQTKKFQEELDKIYNDEYEEAKYKPLSEVVQAYKISMNIYQMAIHKKNLNNHKNTATTNPISNCNKTHDYWLHLQLPINSATVVFGVYLSDQSQIRFG